MSKLGEDWAERRESHPPGPEQGDEKAAPKWTPGPWEAEVQEPFSADNFHIVDGDGEPIAAIYSAGGSDEEEANARLIASAPALYEKAARLLSRAESVIHTDAVGNRFRMVLVEDLDDLRAALAASRGEGR